MKNALPLQQVTGVSRRSCLIGVYTYLNIRSMKSKFFFAAMALLVCTGAMSDVQAQGADVCNEVVFHNRLLASPASFPGGPEAMRAYINENVSYPDYADNATVSGEVQLSFYVEKDGSVSKVRIEKGLNEVLDAEAMQLVYSMPCFIPGRNAQGQTVRALCHAVIPFTGTRYVAQDETPEVYQPPCYAAGNDALIKHLAAAVVYPQEAIDRDVQGTVYVSFVVEKQGDLSDIKVLKSLTPECDRAAVNALKSLPGRFLPGKTRSGEPVRARLTLPVTFLLKK